MRRCISFAAVIAAIVLVAVGGCSGECSGVQNGASCSHVGDTCALHALEFCVLAQGSSAFYLCNANQQWELHENCAPVSADTGAYDTGGDVLDAPARSDSPQDAAPDRTDGEPEADGTDDMDGAETSQAEVGPDAPTE